MTAKELMKAGRLKDARRLLIEEVKTTPADVGKRTLLFQVLALNGEWDKAVRHLDMISTQDPDRSIGVHAYLDMMKAEQERLKVMKRRQQPSIMPGAPPYLPQYMAYLDALEKGGFEEARGLIARIDEARPGVSGTVNGRPFAGFSETDARLYAFLEVFVHDRYVWIPPEAIQEIIIHEPRDSFDLIWVTATITTWEGLSMNCCMPVVYPESFLAPDDQAKLGRLTDWVPLGGGLSRGVGQHVYQIGEEDMAILDISQITFAMAGD
jgi:type VI secretion system protein ImpE